MELDTYSFEAAQDDMLFDGQQQTGQSRLLDPAETALDGEYSRLHLAEVGQAVVYYSRQGAPCAAILTRSRQTDGMHHWRLATVQAEIEGSQESKRTVTVATTDAEGFMNRHMYLQPGDTLEVTYDTDKDAARIETIGRITAVLMKETRAQAEENRLVFEDKPTMGIFRKMRDYWADHFPFMRAA
ncbi:MAG TPA: hypothetical protein VJ843_01015 [Candidatus Saccharimonadales bacterium]|nr:hypothetical protein [Candidatus Saccharimonadales bacterium]